jgi:hypothetical protein
MHGESDTRFFCRVVNAQITVEPAPDGTAAALACTKTAEISGGYDHPEAALGVSSQQKVRLRRNPVTPLPRSVRLLITRSCGGVRGRSSAGRDRSDHESCV